MRVCVCVRALHQRKFFANVKPTAKTIHRLLRRLQVTEGFEAKPNGQAQRATVKLGEVMNLSSRFRSLPFEAEYGMLSILAP